MKALIITAAFAALMATPASAGTMDLPLGIYRTAPMDGSCQFLVITEGGVLRGIEYRRGPCTAVNQKTFRTFADFFDPATGVVEFGAATLTVTNASAERITGRFEIGGYNRDLTFENVE